MPDRVSVRLIITMSILMWAGLTTAGCIQGPGQAGTQALQTQGFLSASIKDLLALLGGVVLIVETVLKLRRSIRLGRIRSLYTRYLLPRLLERSYEKTEIQKINGFLEDLAIGKLTANTEDERQTGVDQLAALPWSDRSFQALVDTLAHEKSAEARERLVNALQILLGARNTAKEW